VAIGFGFAGVLMILRPGFMVIPNAAWVVLASAIAYALSHTLTKKLSSQGSALSILFYMHIMQLPLALVCVAFDFSWPQGIIWIYVIITAVAAITAHYCMAKALTYGDAMLVMPMDFLRLPLIAVIGILLYGEAIDLWLIWGAGIMLLGNMFALKEKSSK
jgi:drug/metabolite transporter (DMT)-like permease